MTFQSIQEAMNKGSGTVHLRGWVYRIRTSKKLAFLVLRDSTNIIQCVIEQNTITPQEWDLATTLQIEASVQLTGTIKEDKRAPTGYEIHVNTIELIGESDQYPIQKDQSPEWLLDNRHLWLRSRHMVAIMKVRATVMDAFREYYQKKEYTEFTPPILQPTQCEGGSTLFPVKYYDDEVYLTQTGQLYSEAMIFALEKIFLISPTFRAEKSKTSRHLSEFWMAEMEAAWMNLDELCDDVEQLLTHIVARVLKDHKKELTILGRDTTVLEKIVPPFPRMTYKEALALLKEKEGLDIPFGKDLRTIEENKLSHYFDKPLIITHYPKEIMAFYKPADPKNPSTALCLDVIAPEEYGEIIGGSQRDLDVEQMKQALRHDGEDPKNYSWYFDLRKYGSVPHSGHGMGVERVVAWICKLDNIKDAIPFPRTIKRFTP
ncbi:asparagine--tRNA ligase [Candidatus Woesearchaeota archaeon]|nr:asparagine--tRNA ligase [Candidatus Woesearchaeota archaeon]